MEETQVPTAPETQNQAPETVIPQPEQTDQDSTAPEGEAESPADDADKPEKTPEQREVERLRRQLTKAQRVNGRLSVEAQQAKEQLQRYVPQQQEAPLDLSQIDANTFQQVVRSEAEKLAAQQLQATEVKRSTDQTVRAGQKAYGVQSFDAATNAFVEEVGGVKDEIGNINPIVRAVLRMSDSHAVIKYLGDNPEIASELPSLDPFELGLKLAEVKAKALSKPEPKETAAPKPLPSLKGTATGTKDPAQMSDREFAEWRKRQIAQRR